MQTAFGIFQSTLPVWGATVYKYADGAALDISIHAPRVGSDSTGRTACHRFQISIHAPRVGSDNENGDLGSLIYISIHAPRVGSDDILQLPFLSLSNFNPRSPCGERPSAQESTEGQREYFNPRSPCGERRKPHPGRDHREHISIHAPRVGSDRLRKKVG